jgi:nucleoside-diphosphate-sugar epimerase
VEALLARGESSVRILDLVKTDLFAAEEADGSVLVFQVRLCLMIHLDIPTPLPLSNQGSLEDKALVERAMAGVNVVIHTAALVDYWSRFDFEAEASARINYHGTVGLLAAAKAAGVRKFLHTSSISVVLNEENLTKVIGWSQVSVRPSILFPPKPRNNSSMFGARIYRWRPRRTCVTTSAPSRWGRLRCSARTTRPRS